MAGAPFDPVANGLTPYTAPAQGAAPGFGPLTPTPGAPTMTTGAAIPLGNPPAFDEAMRASGKMYQDAVASDAGYNARMQTLNEAQHGLQSAGGTGPGTETTNYINSFLLAQAPSMVSKQSADEVSNYDLAVKNLAAWAAAQQGSQRSDMGQQLAETANASTHISNAAAQHVIRQAMGLQMMDHAAVTKFTNEQGPQAAGQYGTWLNQTFTPNNHPMGYVFNSLPDPDKQALVTQYQNDRGALSRIIQSKKNAESLGINPAPAGQ